jgi:DNA-binding NarL/FixJ family response regulator
MTATTGQLRVVIDPLLAEHEALRALLSDVEISVSFGALPICDIAVLDPSTARAALAQMPSTVEVIVAANVPDYQRLLDLYDAGAAVVTVGAPAEELAARVRAIARRLHPVPPQYDDIAPPDAAAEAGRRGVRRAAAARAAARAGGIMSLALVLLGSAEAVSTPPDHPSISVVSQS